MDWTVEPCYEIEIADTSNNDVASDKEPKEPPEKIELHFNVDTKADIYVEDMGVVVKQNDNTETIEWNIAIFNLGAKDEEVIINTENCEGFLWNLLFDSVDSKPETTLGKKRYKCKLCDYQSCYRNWLKRHVVHHMLPAQKKLYICDICSFETKRKSNLISHNLLHNQPPEKVLYCCSYCEYITKRKFDLKRHATLIHLKNLEQKGNCTSRDIQKVDKSSIEKQGKQSVAKTYKCTKCPYVTKRKHDLIRHLNRRTSCKLESR